MDGIKLEPGQVLDEAWAAAARALDPSERDQLLERADALREQAADLVYSCYRVFRDVIDDERLVWTLAHMRRVDHELEPAARRAAAAVPRTDLWFQGQLSMAHFEREAGRFDDSIRRLGELARDVEGEQQGIALAKLTLLMLQAGRLVEGLLVGRRAVRALDGYERARALQLLAYIYAHYRDWERYDECRTEVESLTYALPAREREHLRSQDLVLLLRAAVRRGDFAGALVAVDRMDQQMPHHQQVLREERAYLYLRRGRLDDARALGELPPAPPGRELIFARTRVLTAVLCEPPAVARDRLEAFFVELAQGAAAPGARLDALRGIVDVLDKQTPFAVESMQACDLVAEAIFERIRQVDKFTRCERPLLTVDREDRRELGRLRDAFVADHEVLRRAIIRRFESDAELRASWYQKSGLLHVCAWCDQVRAADGLWVPIGSLLPDDRRLHIAHGMCADCRADEVMP